MLPDYLNDGVTWPEAVLTLGLFGPDPRDALTNDQPLVSGNYSQHVYLGTPGAQALAARSRAVAAKLSLGSHHSPLDRPSWPTRTRLRMCPRSRRSLRRRAKG